ncbi:uncharacterized protein O3C94_020306 [Discoglossus pictus]
MNRSKKKVTFNENPVYCSSRRRTENHKHSGILQHYHSFIVEHLSLTSSLYRRLKENGILSVDQIGLLELEESKFWKVSKLIEVLKNADDHVFTTFCAILHETGHYQLAQTLQKASRDNRQMLPSVPSTSQPRQVLNAPISLHHEGDRTVKDDNLQMRKKIQEMRKKYMTNLQELEERISLAKWERELVVKERNIILNENEALQNLNTELEALFRRLQETALHSNIQDLRFSVDFTKDKSRTLHPHLGLIYR